MKHVIVIETVDPSEGGKLVPPDLAEILEKTVETGVEDYLGICCVRGRFNVGSVVDALHEMYGLPPWNGGEGWHHRDF